MTADPSRYPERPPAWWVITTDNLPMAGPFGEWPLALVARHRRAEQLRVEAGEELSAFSSRMPPEARAKASEAAFARLVRESAGLPTITYE